MNSKFTLVADDPSVCPDLPKNPDTGKEPTMKKLTLSVKDLNEELTLSAKERCGPAQEKAPALFHQLRDPCATR